MIRLNLLWPLLLLLLLYNQCASALILPNPSNQTSPLSDQYIHCYPISPAPTIPLYTDCFLALIGLPHSPVTATFHSGDPDDEYKLPFKKLEGTCKVIVELKDLVTQADASWYDIVKRGFVVQRECVEKGEGFGGYGYEGLGELEWIKITVMGNELGDGNETVGGAVVTR